MTDTVEEPTVEREQPRWAAPLLTLVVFVWLVLSWRTGWAAVGHLGDRLEDTFFLWPFTSPAYSAEEAQDDALRFTTTAVIPLAGAGLALLGRRRLAAAVLVTGAAIVLVLGLFLHALATPDESEPDDNWPPVCQEHSGEDTRCPGG